LSTTNETKGTFLWKNFDGLRFWTELSAKIFLLRESFRENMCRRNIYGRQQQHGKMRHFKKI
jgi:hypothetical protein